MRGDRERPEGKRKTIVDQYGWDVKFGYHVLRLLDEAEQILETGDLVLGRNREILKEVRRGEWTEARVREHFAERETYLAGLYEKSSLPHSPDHAKIGALLLDCLEEHYGSLSAVVARPDAADRALAEIRANLDRYGIRP